MSHAHGSEVVLHLYDLSMGMARAMSMAFIGKQIDYIPHTGIVVYGNEYFYGGGVQVLPPHQVVEYFGLAPVEKIPLGRTTKSLEELRAFLRSISHRFTATSYDLFRNNCNNFTNEVAQFLLSSGIPDRILRVPEEVLSTPMGQTIGGMWNNMQSNMGSRMGATGAAWDPFTGGRGAGAPLLPSGIPAGTPTITPQVPVTATTPGSTLQQASRPLLSAEPGNVNAVLDRIRAVNESLPSDSPHRLSSSDLSVLSSLPSLLSSPLLSSPAEPSISPALPPRSSITTGLQSCNILSRCLRTWPRSTGAFPVLSILRLLVLREECVIHLASAAKKLGDASADASGTPTIDGAADLPEVGILWDILETMSLDSEGYGSLSANVMALSVLANAFKTTIGLKWAVHQQVLNQLINLAVRELRHERKELRQMSAALAFNLCNSMPVGSDTAGAGSSSAEGDATVLVTDASVQLLGGLLEDLPSEVDAEATRRRLLAVGRLLHREGPAAAELLLTLGFDENVRAVAAGEHPAEVKTVASEVMQLLKTEPAY